MIIHWNAKDAGPTSQIILTDFNSFTSGQLAVAGGLQYYRGFIININRLNRIGLG